MSNSVHVAVAVIVNKQNEVLISLRSEDAHQGGFWEFPGGKLESGESVFSALKREVKEELNMTIHKATALKTIRHQYTDKTVLLDVWRVTEFSGEAKGVEGQQIKWLPLDELKAGDFPAANRIIIQILTLPERYMITGAFENHADFKSKLENSFKKGVSLVQLRCKKIAQEEYKQLIEIAETLSKTYGAILLLNTSAGVFLETHAHGLHMSSDMLRSFESRPIADDFLLSVSCHTQEEVEKAKRLKADIILLSPIKETRSHPGVKGIGWEKFVEISSSIGVPVYALGGMGETDLIDAKSSGAQGVAAISSFWG